MVADENEIGYVQAFRDYAYGLSPAFGREVDRLIVGSAGLGAADNTTAPMTTGSGLLDKIVNGLDSAAAAAQLSLKSYFDAMTAVNTMKSAYASGVPVDQYKGPAQTVGLANALTELGKIKNLLMIGGLGLAAILVMRK